MTNKYVLISFILFLFSCATKKEISGIISNANEKKVRKGKAYLKRYTRNFVNSISPDDLNFIFTGDFIEKDDSSRNFTSKFNNHKVIKIGTQLWMMNNLDVDTFNNGDKIPEVQDFLDWIIAGSSEKPAWCYYGGNPIKGEKYGRIYNWYALNDPRGLAPAGFRLPDDKDWAILSKSLGGDKLSGKKLKSKNEWSNKGNGNNKSGFQGYPGGLRSLIVHDDEKDFIEFGKSGYWWSMSDNKKIANYFTLKYNKNRIFKGNMEKSNGMYIRCLRDTI